MTPPGGSRAAVLIVLLMVAVAATVACARPAAPVPAAPVPAAPVQEGDPAVPPVAPLQTPVGVARWAADLRRPDSVAAGFTDNPSNRELADGKKGAVSLPWPVPVVDGPEGRRALRITLPDRAVRLEVEPNHRTYGEGDEAWFGFSFRLDRAFPLDAQAFQVIEQLHAGPPVGSPPVSFQVAKGGLLLDGGYGKPGAITPAQFTYQRRLADLVVERWYDVVYHVHFSMSAASSTVDVWVDGNPVLAGFHPPGGTVYPGRPGDHHVGTYRKEGLYHSSSIAGGTLYLTGQRTGVSYADAYPRPYAGPR